MFTPKPLALCGGSINHNMTKCVVLISAKIMHVCMWKKLSFPFYSCCISTKIWHNRKIERFHLCVSANQVLDTSITWVLHSCGARVPLPCIVTEYVLGASNIVCGVRFNSFLETTLANFFFFLQNIYRKRYSLAIITGGILHVKVFLQK